jgi:hypothetical protein
MCVRVCVRVCVCVLRVCVLRVCVCACVLIVLTSASPPSPSLSQEADVTNNILIERIKQSEFKWINSNMRAFPHHLTEFYSVNVTSPDGLLTKKVGP